MSVSAPISKNSTFFSSSSPAKSSNRPAPHFWSPCRFGSSSNATLICYLHRPFEPFSTALIQNIQQLDKDSRNKSISSIVESKVRQSNILKPAACFHHSVTCYSLIYLLLCLQIIPSLSASLLLGRGNSNKTNNDPLELYKNNFNDSVTQPAETSNSILIIKNDSVPTVKYSSNKNNFTNFVLFSAKSNKWPMPNSSIYKNVDTKCSVPKECSDNVSSVYSKPLSDTIQQFINISKATNNNTDTVNEHTVSNGDKNVSESASERELPLLGKSFLSTSDSNDSSLFFSLQRAHMNVSQKNDNPFVKAKHKKPKKIITYQNDHLLRNSNDSILVNRDKIKTNSRELNEKKNYSKYSENFDYRRFRYFGKRDDNSNSVDVGKNNSTSTESADKSKKLTSAADGIVTKIYPGPTSTSSHVVNQKVPAVTTTPQGAKARASKRKPQQERGPAGMRRVSLLGLFELSTRWGERPEGRSELAAALLAVKHVNERRLLPGYYLHLLTNDTKCDPGVGVDRFFHALYTQTSTRMVMLLGSACSEVTESLAKVVPYWNIVQVSFGSTSPALSDRNEFPLFYRTVAPDSSHNPARIAFIRRFGWDTVTALSQNEEVYSLAVNDLVTELEQANITCAATITFAETDFKEQLKLLRELDTRIIIGSFSHEMAPKIFCEAYELGMFGADYAWILQGPPLPAWWKNSTECAQGNLVSAVDRLILVSSHNSIVGEEMVSYSGLTNDMFMAEMKSMKVPLSRYAPQTYDAVWAIALALRGAETAWARSQNLTLESFFSRKLMSIGKPTHPPGHMTPEKEARQQTRNTTGNKYTTSIKNFKNQIPSTSFFSLGHFDYTRKDMAEEFLQQIGHLNFLGVSGPVSFSGADRVGTSAFYQVQDGVAHPVALFEPAQGQLDFECPACRGVDWRGGQVPVAKRVFKRRIETIAPAAFLAVTSLALVGVVLAIAFLAFNLHFRRIKSIKLSSPRLNNMTIVGCILVYGAVALLGLDHATLPASVHFSVICTARVYLLTAGFSLAFGSMFAKTYRVHRIFIGNRSGVCKNKLLQDTQLISLICALLLIDGLIVTLWVVIDPMQRHLRNLTLEISSVDRGVVYQPQVEVCQSQNTNGWLGALYVYKGLLLVVGVYMAWETRHVKISALNDSQYIGISVYSVVITSGIVVVLANIISERATLAYVSITTLILISTTATLCLLFLPKLLAILKKEDNTDPIIQSMGLKLECNTRRFMTDDKRELQYRVEIQNKVYRREMAALDKEINRLERLLTDSNPNSNSSSSTSLVQHKKMELTVAQEGQGRKPSRDEYARTPSIGGGLPLLLLSVLPPVIPRASWPSSENAHLPMRRSVTFSSEPKLDDGETQPAIDLYNLRLLNRRPDENTGLLARIRNLFGSRPASRKTSSASIAGNSGAGIAAALKLHMGMIAGLVPGAQRHNMVLSCNTLDVHGSRRNLRRESFARSGPTINILSDDTYDDREGESSKNFNETLLFSSLIKRESQKNMLETEAKVNFRLPPDRRRPSVTHQISQPVLSFKDRAKGSPRFPHKIVPTCSLSTLDDQRKASMGNTLNVALIDSNFRRSSHQPQTDRPTVPRPSLDRLMGGRWKSMEDATLTLPGSRRGSGLLAVSYIPSDVYHHRRPDLSMITPDRDVWATADFGIPLSRLDVEVEGQRAKYIRKDNSESSLS